MTRQKVAHGTTYEPSFSLDFHERDVYGATVTAINLADGETRTFTRTNLTALDALNEVCLDLDALNEQGDQWRVRTVSTPSTIARDMYASRIRLGGQGVGGISEGSSPEALMLGRLGRGDLRYYPPYAAPTFDGPKTWRP